MYENTITKLNNSPYARKLGNKYTIKEIFSKFWDKFYAMFAYENIRPSILIFLAYLCRLFLACDYYLFLDTISYLKKANKWLYFYLDGGSGQN